MTGQSDSFLVYQHVGTGLDGQFDYDPISP